MTESPRTLRTKRAPGGELLRQVRGRPVMVVMARAKACTICGEPNDSRVTRSANGMFQHYSDCSDCREGSEVRDALSAPPHAKPPSLRKRGGRQMWGVPASYNREEDVRAKKRAYNRRVYGKAIRHPRVIFGLNEPGVEYYEIPAQGQDWRVTLKANIDESPKR